MKSILFFFVASYILVSCCPQNQVYPVPDKIKYSKIIVNEIRTHVVNDSFNYGFKTIKTDSSLISLINSFYTSYFENERIQTIDFKDSLKADVAFYSLGKVIKTIHTHYSPIYGEIDLIGSLSNSYVTLNIYNLNNATIPYTMYSYKKQGQTGLINNVIASSFYSSPGDYVSIPKLINSDDLKNNDTIYSGAVQLFYTTY